MIRYRLFRGRDGWWRVRAYRDNRYAWGRAFATYVEAHRYLGLWLERRRT